MDVPNTTCLSSSADEDPVEEWLTTAPKCVRKRSRLFVEHVRRRLFWLLADDYISKNLLLMPLMQMRAWQQLRFLGCRPSCTPADSKSAFFPGMISHDAAYVNIVCVSRPLSDRPWNYDGSHAQWWAYMAFWPWWSREDDTGANQVSRFTATVTSWKASELQTDCSCRDFSFMRSGSGPGTFFFIFHGSKVVLSTFPCSFCNIKKNVSGKKRRKREADCDFGVWGWDCNCLLAGTEMLFLDSLLRSQSRTLSLKEASWKKFYFLLSALFISFG